MSLVPVGIDEAGNLPLEARVALAASAEIAARVLSETREADRTATGVAAAKFGLVPGSGDQTLALQALMNANTRRRLLLGAVGQILAHGMVLNRPIKMEGSAADSGRFQAADGSYYGQSLAAIGGFEAPQLTVATRNATLESLHFDGRGIAGAKGMVVENGFELRSRRMRWQNFKDVAVRLSLMANAVLEDYFIDNCGAPGVAALVIDSLTGRTNNLRMPRLTVERAAGPFVNVGIMPDGTPIGTQAERDAAITKYIAEWVDFDDPHMEAAPDNGGIPNTDPLWNIGIIRHMRIRAGMHYGGPGPLLRYNQPIFPSFGGGNLVIGGGSWLGSDTGADMPGQPGAKVPATEYLHDLVKGDKVTYEAGTHFDRYTKAAIRIGAEFGREVYIDPKAIATGAMVEDNRPNTVAARAPYEGVTRSRRVSRASKPTLTNPAGITGGTLLGTSDVNRGAISFGTTGDIAAGAMIMQINVPEYASADQPFVTLTSRNIPTSVLGQLAVAVQGQSGMTGTWIRIYTPTAITGAKAAGSFEFNYHIEW